MGSENGELAMCNSKLKSLEQKLLSVEQSMDLSKHISSFRNKSESGLSFLQHVLSLLDRSHVQDAESDAALFLCIIIIILPDRPLRIALHERLLTLKRQLEEGKITSWRMLTGGGASE